MTEPAPRGILRLREFRWLLATRGANAFGSSALLTVLGFQVYDLTRDPLALGWLGLVAGLPALALGLLGGHIADRRDRRSIVLVTGAALAILVLVLAVVSAEIDRFGLIAILAVVFLTGVASGFERPALTALEAQVIPLPQASEGASWVSATAMIGGVIGAPLGGLFIVLFGIPTTYLLLAVILAVSPLATLRIARRPMPAPDPGGSMLASVSEGLRYVFKRQPLWGSMTLDLFAVLFGGVEALLPIFAADILHVGPVGLGLLRTAPAVGALLVMLVATRYPPRSRAGPLLFGCVAAFGCSILVFGLSTSFPLSLAALVVFGAADAVSVIIRVVTVRVFSPEHMRGRIASVSYLFIGASNEIGAFESGFVARLLGPVPAVLLGGLVTIGTVGVVALLAPELRRLDLGKEGVGQDELVAVSDATATG